MVEFLESRRPIGKAPAGSRASTVQGSNHIAGTYSVSLQTDGQSAGYGSTPGGYQVRYQLRGATP